MDEFANVNLFGDGYINGGKYNKIKIFGDSLCNEDVECNSLIIMGESKFENNLKSQSIKVMGELDVSGKFICGNCRVLGECDLRNMAEIDSLKIMGEVRAIKELVINSNLNIMGNINLYENLKGNIIKVMGEGIIEKNVIFNDINILGRLEVKGNCEGNNFYNKGEVRINGLLSADKVEIVPKRVSIIEEIGGSEITIKKSKLIESLYGKVVSKLIEGDKITLQNTECKIVRGHDITILSGCNIGKIEYTGSLTVDENSEVGEKICLRN